jgi:hypothetical protein
MRFVAIPTILRICSGVSGDRGGTPEPATLVSRGGVKGRSTFINIRARLNHLSADWNYWSSAEREEILPCGRDSLGWRITEDCGNR